MIDSIKYPRLHTWAMGLFVEKLLNQLSDIPVIFVMIGHIILDAQFYKAIALSGETLKFAENILN